MLTFCCPPVSLTFTFANHQQACSDGQHSFPFCVCYHPAGTSWFSIVWHPGAGPVEACLANNHLVNSLIWLISLTQFAHAVGFRATEILNVLAALYRGRSLESVSSRVALTERNLWPTHLKPHLQAANSTAGKLSLSDAGPESQEVCCSQGSSVCPVNRYAKCPPACLLNCLPLRFSLCNMQLFCATQLLAQEVCCSQSERRCAKRPQTCLSNCLLFGPSIRRVQSLLRCQLGVSNTGGSPSDSSFANIGMHKTNKGSCSSAHLYPQACTLYTAIAEKEHLTRSICLGQNRSDG